MKEFNEECPKCKQRTFVVDLNASEITDSGIRFRKGECRNNQCGYSFDDDSAELNRILLALSKHEIEETEKKLSMLPPYLKQAYEYNFFSGYLNFLKKNFENSIESFGKSKELFSTNIERAGPSLACYDLFWNDYLLILAKIKASKIDEARHDLKSAFLQINEEKSALEKAEKGVEKERLMFLSLVEFSYCVLNALAELRLKSLDAALGTYNELKAFFLTNKLKLNPNTEEQFFSVLIDLEAPWRLSNFRIVVLYIKSRILQEQFIQVFKSVMNSYASEDLEKELRWFEQIISRYLPYESNPIGNDFWYWPIKLAINELFFEHYCRLGKIERAFNYIEKNGVDFVKWAQDFVIWPDDFPGPYKFEYEKWGYMYGNLDMMDGMVEENWEHPLKAFYLPAQMYWEFLKNRNIKKIAEKEIKERIVLLANRIEASEEDYFRLTFPSYVGLILEEKIEFDEAIHFYTNSNLDENERLRAVERCKLKRDGIQYERLREVLRNLNSDKQRQLVAYARFFELETRLRKAISLILEKRHGNKNWWNAYVPESIKKRCSTRLDEWKTYQISKEPHEIEFTTFSELIEVVLENWEKAFKTHFRNKKLFSSILYSLEPIRNDVAHARLLPPNRFEELEMQTQKLDKQLGEIEKTLNSAP